MKQILILVACPSFGASREHAVLSGYHRSLVLEKAGRAGLPINAITFDAISRSPRWPNGQDFSDCLARINTQNFDCIIPLDEPSLKFTTGKTSIRKWHMSPLESLEHFNCRKIMPSFHPDAIQKEFHLSTYLEMALLKIKAAYNEDTWTRKEKRFHLDPGVDQAIAILESIRHEPWHSVDIETGSDQINTFGVAWSKHDALAIKILPDNIPAPAHKKLWNLIAEICESDSKKIAQNGIYERMYLSRYGIYLNNFTHDTMCAMRLLWPELEKGLDNVGRLYTSEPYWKDDGKVHTAEGARKDWSNIKDWNAHLDYNCLAKGVKVITDQGAIPIDEIARKKMNVKVRSFDQTTGQFEWRPVRNWLVKKESLGNWLRIKTTGMRGKHGLVLTKDHKVLTETGWLKAEELSVGDAMLSEELVHHKGTILGTLLGDSSFGKTSDESVRYVQCSQIHGGLIRLKQQIFGGTHNKAMRSSGFNTKSRIVHDLYIPPQAQLKDLEALSMSEILSMLSDFGIALWFMDDGCKQKPGKGRRSGHMKLALQSYTRAEQEEVLNFMCGMFGECSLDAAGNISLSNSASAVLCAELGKYFPPCVRYKLSHAAPRFSLDACLVYQSRTGLVRKEIIEIEAFKPKSRGYQTSYCLTEPINGNFLTQYGIVANCKDTANTYEAAMNQIKNLEDRGLKDVYTDYIAKLFDPTYEMSVRGLPLNLQTQKTLVAEYEKKSKDLLATMSAKINPRSAKQKIKLLTDKGLELPKKRDKRAGGYKDSADELTLKKARLKYPNDQDIKALLEISGIEKALSSYLRVKAHSDNFIRYMLDPFSTETGRMACRKDVWDRGFNAQTMTDYIKSMIEWKPEDDRVFVEIDLSQAESRFVAYDANETTLLGMLERREDIHRFVAAEIYQKPMAEIVHDERQLGKKSGHGANYNMGPGTFMDSCLKEMDLVIDRKMATRVLDSYHKLFPGIRKWHERIRNEVYTKRKLTNPLGLERYFLGRLDDNTYREAYAYRPQSTIPMITNHLILKLCEQRKLGKLNFWLHAQIHDSCLLSCRPSEIEPIAEFAKNLGLWHPEIILPAGKLLIPTDLKFGRNLGKVEKYAA